MTTTATPPSATAPTAVAAPSRLARALDATASEWIKLRATRSTYWTLLIAAMTGVGFSAIIAFTFAHAPATVTAGPPPDPLLPGLLSLEYAILAVGVLGVLTFTTEHSTGLIRTTYTATPHRRTVLAAKASVVGVVTLILGEAIAFASFGLDQAILSVQNRLSITAPGVPGAVAATGILLAVSALLGVGLGAIVRHTAGAIIALVALIVVPTAVGLLPAPWNDRIGGYTLINAAQQVAVHHPNPALLTPGWSLLVLIAWPAVALGIAALLITRQDT